MKATLQAPERAKSSITPVFHTVSNTEKDTRPLAFYFFMGSLAVALLFLIILPFVM